jgi:AraC-like DNA-binding protein
LLNIETYKPERFSDLIERVWIAENFENEAELVIPPNQYVNLIFPLKKSKYKRNQIWIDSPQIEGISTQNSVLTYPVNTKLIGVRFFAFGLFPFVQTHGKDLFNNSLNCLLKNEIVEKNFVKSVDNSDTAIIENVYKILSTIFCREFYDMITPIMNFYNQYRWAEKTNSLEEYCRNINSNYTSLNRNFTKIIGITPKRFERLIKFRKSLCSLIDSNDNLTSIGVNSGYFDQAHFIREFKLFLNQTPSSYKKIIKEADKESRIINYNFKLF